MTDFRFIWTDQQYEYPPEWYIYMILVAKMANGQQAL